MFKRSVNFGLVFFIFFIYKLSPAFCQQKSKNLVLTEQIGNARDMLAEAKILFYSPLSADIDNKGNMYILDGSEQSIIKLDSLNKQIWKTGRLGNGPGEFMFRNGMINAGFLSIDNNGSIYVIDNCNYRVQTFNNEGTYINSFKIGWVMNDVCANKDKILLQGVCANNDFMIHQFDSSGNAITSFGRKYVSEPKMKMFNHAFITMDKNENVYLLAQCFPILRKYSRNNNLVWEKQMTGERYPEDLRKYFKDRLSLMPDREKVNKFKVSTETKMMNKLYKGPIFGGIHVENGYIYISLCGGYILKYGLDSEFLDSYYFKADNAFLIWGKFCLNDNNIIILDETVIKKYSY